MFDAVRRFCRISNSESNGHSRHPEQTTLPCERLFARDGKEVTMPDTKDLSAWLASHDLTALESILKAEGFDLATVLEIEDADLIAIGVKKLGLRKRLLKAAQDEQHVEEAAQDEQHVEEAAQDEQHVEEAAQDEQHVEGATEDKQQDQSAQSGLVTYFKTTQQKVIFGGVGLLVIAGILADVNSKTPCDVLVDLGETGFMEQVLKRALGDGPKKGSLHPKMKALIREHLGLTKMVNTAGKVCNQLVKNGHKEVIVDLARCVTKHGGDFEVVEDQCEPPGSFIEALQSAVKESELQQELRASQKRARDSDFNREIVALHRQIENKSSTAQSPISNYNRYKCKAMQSEAKSNLKAIFQAQMSYRAAYDEYGTLAEIGFRPEPGNRYTYCIAADDCIGCETGSNMTDNKSRCNGVGSNQDGCFPTASRTGSNALVDRFTACATANLDSEHDLDAWRINDSNALINDDNDCN
jgi:hypothetical protein